jgi:hypothetical protein
MNTCIGEIRQLLGIRCSAAPLIRQGAGSRKSKAARVRGGDDGCPGLQTTRQLKWHACDLAVIERTCRCSFSGS